MATFTPLETSTTPSLCDCQHSTSLLVGEITRTSEGLNKTQPQPIPLDDALILGRRLTLDWERVNGCFNVEQHLDPAALLVMVGAIEGLLGIYEVSLQGTLSRPLASEDQVLVTPVPTSLGPLVLDEEEAGIVAQEALRHMVARLGDMLKDIEEEGGQMVESGNGPSGRGSEILVDVRRAQGLMFRLLGRVPR